MARTLPPTRITLAILTTPLLLLACTTDTPAPTPTPQPTPEDQATSDDQPDTPLTVTLPDNLPDTPTTGTASTRPTTDPAPILNTLAGRLSLTPDTDRNTATNDTATLTLTPDGNATRTIVYSSTITADQPADPDEDRILQLATSLLDDIHPDQPDYTWYYSPAAVSNGLHIVTATAPAGPDLPDSTWRLTYTDDGTLTQLTGTIHRTPTDTRPVDGRSSREAAQAAADHLTENAATLSIADTDITLDPPTRAEHPDPDDPNQYQPVWQISTNTALTLHVPLDPDRHITTNRDPAPPTPL